MPPFTYVVLRYVHDSVTGESLNVGVLLVSSPEEYANCRLEMNHGRLAAAFRDFDSEFHRHTMRGLDRDVRRLRDLSLHGQRSLFPLGDAGKLIRTLWPDTGLSYRASEVKVGATENLDRTLESLFKRFVTSQEPDRRGRRRRDDEDVWRDVHRHLPAKVAMRLHSASVEAGPFVFKFDHAYQNGRLHVVEPLSFDLLESDTVRDKSMRWIGYASHLKPYLGTLNLVVEGPTREEVRPAYHSALGILRNVTDVYEIDQAEKLTRELERIMA